MFDRMELIHVGEGLSVYVVGGNRFIIESVCDHLGLRLDDQLARIGGLPGLVVEVGFLPGEWVDMLRLAAPVVHTLPSAGMAEWLAGSRVGRGKGTRTKAVLHARLATYRAFFDGVCSGSSDVGPATMWSVSRGTGRE